MVSIVLGISLLERTDTPLFPYTPMLLRDVFTMSTVNITAGCTYEMYTAFHMDALCEQTPP